MTSPSSIPWHHYLNRRILICVFLGFTSGLPLYILLNLLIAWLAKSGLDVKALGLFALVMFPYNVKFLWAPLMDRFHFGRIGRRRGWMGLTQCALFLMIGWMGMLDPHTQLSMVVFFTVSIAFLSASQDIAIDAYRRELLPDSEQGLGTAIYVNAFKVSSMVPAALSLILADRMAWQPVFWITAAFMLPGLLCTIMISEPKLYGAPPKNMRDAVLMPFQEFITRNGVRSALWILSFIFLYKLGDSMATALSTKFYLDLGFSMTQIGLISKTTSLWASVLGAIIGGIWMVKLGINRALWIFGVVQAVTILGFAWLAQAGAQDWKLALVVGAEAFGIGLGTACFVAYIARTTDPRYTATQFALFTALAVVPRTFMNSLTGYMVAETGWFMFFIICFLLSFPGMMMLPKVAPWHGDKLENNGG
ncbi:AmpG family muropeptide MFS transporter [Glaciimonas soli]|uniref:MFS transporter n=1 Tax=Glaciimonas soli TaxID=2590999 RepID=A0A843YRM5_9BURK|nr:AmpG family muropeptide MFS transporter [Glaciimonas soli]MQR00647.1 MFS transporter [Glaciimonas soli]